MSEITLQDIIKPENLVYKKSSLLTDKRFHYCPGCGHGTIHRIIAEVIEELGLDEQTIGVAPVGCAVMAYDYFDFDFQEAAHGRAPAVATGIKRVWPNKIVFSYQGDGDLAAIGTAETIHACNRGENITMIFVNNGIYGMTGGQMAPTTLEGMKTATSPYGRKATLPEGAGFEGEPNQGYPLHITDLLALLPGTKYITRQAVYSPATVRNTKKAIKKAFENQMNGKSGVNFVEIVSNCNSNWKLDPVAANKWLVDNMLPAYPLGDIKVDGKLVSK